MMNRLYGLNPKDLKIDVFRSTRSNSINRTATAIRITHLPTGKSVMKDHYRSYRQNEDHALHELSKLLNARENNECGSE